MVIAFAGLLINVAVAWSLSRDRQNVNTRAALLHARRSAGFSGGYRRGRHHLGGRPGYCRSAPFDVCWSLLLRATWKVLSESVRILLDGTPEQTNFDAVGEYIRSVPGVDEVHDLHIWTITRGMMLCSATCALLRTSAGRGSCTPFAKASRGALISTTLRFSPNGKAWDRAGIVKVRSA